MSISRRSSMLFLGVAASGSLWAKTPLPPPAATGPTLLQYFDAVKTPIAVAPPTREIREFFGYWCPHCADLDPSLVAWAKTLPPAITFTKTPVAFSPAQVPLATLYYVIESLAGTQAPALHAATFEAIHIHRSLKASASEKDVQEFASKQLRLDAKAVKEKWTSFGVTTQMAKAKAMADTIALEGVPALLVQGRYLTSPAKVSTQVTLSGRDPNYKPLLYKTMFEKTQALAASIALS